MTSFRARLLNQERLFGILLQQPLPAIAEMCADAGFDWLFIDMEHGALDLRDVERIAQAVNARCPCVVRVPVNERMWIGKVLDLGVSGIIIPQVNTPAHAAAAVHAAKYAPQGGRGVGGGRAFGYGANSSAYLKSANTDAALIVQIEHVEAVKNAQAIALVQGVDALMIGPNDLAASMGKLDQLDDAGVQAAIADVLAVGKANRMPMSLYCSDAGGAARAMEQGFTLLPVSTDNALIVRGARALVNALKNNQT